MQPTKRKSRDDFDGAEDAWESYMSSEGDNINETIPRMAPRIDGQAYLFWIVPTLRGKIKGRILSG